MAALAVGREEEILAQLRALLFLPAASPPPPWTQAAPAVMAESAAGVSPLAAIVGSTTGDGRRHGSGPAAAASASSSAMAAGARRRRRRQGQGSKRDRDGGSDANDEQHDEAPAADTQEPQHYPPDRDRCKRRKKQQQSSKSIVTSVPDFDGYQWRKYGQKQIEGAMYPRSYFRCTLSAEQGCQAKRTVQRNDDGGAAPDPEYTVVYVAEHTCTATDSLEAPVILETTTTVVAPAATAASTTTSKGQRQAQDDDDSTYTDSSVVVPTTSTGSCSTSTTAITTGPESPAITGGDDVTCWSSSGASSSDYNYADDDYYCGELFAAAAHGGGWASGPADSASSLQEMEDLTGPIRSPVHVPAPGWTIDQLLLQLANEAVCHF